MANLICNQWQLLINEKKTNFHNEPKSPGLEFIFFKYEFWKIFSYWLLHIKNLDHSRNHCNVLNFKSIRILVFEM